MTLPRCISPIEGSIHAERAARLGDRIEIGYHNLTHPNFCHLKKVTS